ncbi:MAG: hypothetical protein WBX15_19485 [Thermoanaerobaculia bacterium]
MTGFGMLWIPILVAGVAVFVLSSIIHMAPLWHRNDFPKLPDEEGVRAALGPVRIPPGEYIVPRAGTPAEMKSPEYVEKLNQGPVMMMTVLPNGQFGMARDMILWLVYILLVSFFSAYIAGRALPPGAIYLSVFRFAGATAFIGYAVALWQMSIWYRRSWSLTLKITFDGILYAILTGGIFGWLWPR